MRVCDVCNDDTSMHVVSVCLIRVIVPCEPHGMSDTVVLE